jgi:hypothetical protein
VAIEYLGSGTVRRYLIGAVGSLSPVAAYAQAAGSPFETGANSLVTFAQNIGTPIAALIVIGLGRTNPRLRQRCDFGAPLGVGLTGSGCISPRKIRIIVPGGTRPLPPR